MLNELREYDIWASGENTRFKNEFKDGFRGLRRALTIIARHFLFENGDEPDFERAEEALLAWLGKKDSEDIEIHKLYNGVKRNIDSIKIKSTSTLKKDDLYLQLQKKDFTFNSNYFKYSDFKKLNENAIWIEDVIAQASVDGKLKNMCLIADTDVFDGVIECPNSRSSSKFYASRDRVIKFIAMYLLNGGGENKPVKINSIDLIGWFDQGRFPNALETDATMAGTKERIFKKRDKQYDEDISNNNHLYEINSSLIKHFTIQLTDEVKKCVENDPDYLKKYCVYLDKPGKIFQAEELSNFD